MTTIAPDTEKLRELDEDERRAWNEYYDNIQDLTGGKRVTVYPQHEVLKDLIAGRLADGGEIIFGVGETAIHDIETPAPSISFTVEPAIRSANSWA